MTDSDDDLPPELMIEIRHDFCDEATELLDKTEECLLGLENASDGSSFLRNLRGHLHSLKGSASAARLTVLSHALHLLESNLPLTGEDHVLISETLKACDIVREFVASVQRDQDDNTILKPLLARFGE